MINMADRGKDFKLYLEQSCLGAGMNKELKEVPKKIIRSPVQIQLFTLTVLQCQTGCVSNATCGECLMFFCFAAILKLMHCVRVLRD